jgi:hypothetical protein
MACCQGVIEAVLTYLTISTTPGVVLLVVAPHFKDFSSPEIAPIPRLRFIQPQEFFTTLYDQLILTRNLSLSTKEILLKCSIRYKKRCGSCNPTDPVFWHPKNIFICKNSRAVSLLPSKFLVFDHEKLQNKLKKNV